MFKLPLFGWTPPKPSAPPAEESGLGTHVQAILQAWIDRKSATLRARAAYLRAQSEMTDSRFEREAMKQRANECDLAIEELAKP